MASKNIDLELVDDAAEFKVGPFCKVSGKPAGGDLRSRPGRSVVLYVDSWGRAEFDLDTLPVTGFVFDLADKSLRPDAPEITPEATPPPRP